jgi:RNA recognition motif-containing protein
LQLYIGGLDLSVTDEDLNKAFSPYGEITDVKVIVGKQYGFVEYLSRYLFKASLYLVHYIVVAAKCQLSDQ